MTSARREFGERERVVRHARSHGRVNVGVIVVSGVVAVAVAAVFGGAVPGVRPVPRLAVDAAGIGIGNSDLADRTAAEASRSAERRNAEVAGIATAVPTQAPAGALPTYSGAPLAAGGRATPRSSATGAAASPGGGIPATGSGTSTATAPTSSPTGETTSESPTPSITTTTSTSSTTVVVTLGDLEQRLVDLTNTERLKVGCSALTVDSRLADSAHAHAADMVAKQYFDHTGLDGSTPTSRAAAAGYPGGVAENIATGFAVADGVLAAWMASTEGHRENILNCAFKTIGVGYDPGALPTYGGGTWVQTFGSA